MLGTDAAQKYATHIAEGSALIIASVLQDGLAAVVNVIHRPAQARDNLVEVGVAQVDALMAIVVLMDRSG